jgi:hypothetical protein
VRVDTDVTACLRQATRLVAADLQTSDWTDQGILRRYGASIGYCFIPWLSAAATGARSALARDRVFDNLTCEVLENHPFLLYDLLRSQGCLPARADFEQMSTVLRLINTSYSDRGSLTLLSIILLLEEAASLFLPLIARMCHDEGDRTGYIHIHLAADVEHAKLMTEAVEDEYQYSCNGSLDIDTGFGLARRLLQNIFLGESQQGATKCSPS